jgi:hypothetical protein
MDERYVPDAIQKFNEYRLPKSGRLLTVNVPHNNRGGSNSRISQTANPHYSRHNYTASRDFESRPGSWRQSIPYVPHAYSAESSNAPSPLRRILPSKFEDQLRSSASELVQHQDALRRLTQQLPLESVDANVGKKTSNHTSKPLGASNTLFWTINQKENSPTKAK